VFYDTCFLIDLQREWLRSEHGPAHRFLKEHADERCEISVIVYAEFLEGFADPRRGEAFLAGFARAGVSEAIAWEVARLRRMLRQQGTLPGDFDLLIAATALRHHEPLVTRNTAHFARIAGLRCIDYTQA